MSVLALLINGGYTPPPGIVSIRHKAIGDDVPIQHKGTHANKIKRIESIYSAIDEGINTVQMIAKEIECSISTTREAIAVLVSQDRIELIEEYNPIKRYYYVTKGMKDCIPKYELSGNSKKQHEAMQKYRNAMQTPVSAREIAEAVGVSIDAVHAYLPNLEGKRMVKKFGKRPAPKTMPVQLWIWIGE